MLFKILFYMALCSIICFAKNSDNIVSETIHVDSTYNCPFIQETQKYDNCTVDHNTGNIDMSYNEKANTFTFNKLILKIDSTTIDSASGIKYTIIHGYDIEEQSDNKFIIVITTPMTYINIIKIGDSKFGVYVSNVNNDSENLISTGTGFGVDNHHFVTNYHVISGKDTIKIYTHNSFVGYATSYTSDEGLDIAVVTTRAKLHSCKVDPTNYRIGTDIYAYGFPQIQSQGTSLKVTKGIISSNFGYQDDVKQYQIDAAVQPGNSGGPLIHNDKVVGIVSALLIDSQNVNYAIKSSYLTAFLNSMQINFNGKDKPEDCTYLIIAK